MADDDVLDVPALTAFLDGKYASVRALVRTNLAEHASILDDQMTMSRDDFRERVLEVVQLMASTGQTGFGFPEEYGGGADIGASIAAFETLAFGDLSVVVKVGVQFGLFGGAILQLGTKPHHDAYLDDLIHGRLLGCFAMTESGHGSNVQALGTTATYDAAGPRVRDQHPRRPGAQGLHRQRREARQPRGGVRPAGGRRGVARRARVRRTHPRRGREPGARGPDRGRRPQDRAQRRRQRPPVVRRGAGRPHRPARPLRRGHRRRPLLLRHREPEPALLHHARHARAGPGLRRRRGHQRVQGGAGDRGGVRPPPPPVRQPGLGHRGGAARLRHAPAPAVPAAGAHLRAALRPGAGRRGPARGVLRHHRRGRGRAGPAGARVTRGRHQGPGHLARVADDPGVPRGVRRGGLPVGQPLRRAARRHRRVHHLRGRQHDPDAAGGQGAAHRLQGLLRGPRLDRDGPVRGLHGGRDRAGAHQRPLDPGAAARRRTRRRPERRRRPGPARRRLPAGDADLARGAHPGLGGPAAEERDGQGPRPGRGVQPLPGPRDQRRARARRADRAGGVPRQAGHAGGRPEQAGADADVRPLRALVRSRPTGPGSSSTAGCPTRGPRPSRPRSTSSAAGCARSPSSWWTPSACRARCCAPSSWSSPPRRHPTVGRASPAQHVG